MSISCLTTSATNHHRQHDSSRHWRFRYTIQQWHVQTNHILSKRFVSTFSVTLISCMGPYAFCKNWTWVFTSNTHTPPFSSFDPTPHSPSPSPLSLTWQTILRCSTMTVKRPMEQAGTISSPPKSFDAASTQSYNNLICNSQRILHQFSSNRLYYTSKVTTATSSNDQQLLQHSPYLDQPFEVITSFLHTSKSAARQPRSLNGWPLSHDNYLQPPDGHPPRSLTSLGHAQRVLLQYSDERTTFLQWTQSYQR